MSGGTGDMPNHARINSRSIYLVILLSLILSGCTATQPVVERDSVDDSFTRQINPFPVYDQNGTLIDFPFLGGFNAPRPQFVDIDSDGDPDLFVQENSNELMFFENLGASAGFQLVWRTDKFHGLDVGEWFRFADMDQDGDLDLLAEQPYSYIRYYKNEGTPEVPSFTLAADSLRDVNGTPIFSDRQNIPNVTDIDCDDVPDLFIGRLDGTVTRYESTGLNEHDIPQFQLITERFEDIEIVQQFGSLHGANTMDFMDIDDDGDQDLFWGDFFEPGLLLLENEGSCTNPSFRSEPKPFPPLDPVLTSGYNAPTLTDWGRDGDLDLFLGVLGGAYNANQTLGENFFFYEQVDGSFTQITRQFLKMIDIGDESILTIGDLDGDGDLDLLLANKIDPVNDNTSVVYRYENRGTPASPEFHLTGTLDLPNAYHYAPELADVNGDGLDDLLLGSWQGGVAYYINTGDGFDLAAETIAELERGSNAVPELADLDGDGDLDLLLGTSGGGVHFFRNRGTASSPEFTYEPDAFPGVEVQHRSAPALHDIDSDGDLDLFLGSRVEGVLFYRNVGTSTEPEFRMEPLPFSVDLVQLATPHFADLDGDGVVEFLSGGRGGGIFYYRQASETNDSEK
ncbi:MAG: VCBS repeat-containing protein [Balneolaceae bacterium]